MTCRNGKAMQRGRKGRPCRRRTRASAGESRRPAQRFSEGEVPWAQGEPIEGASGAGATPDGKPSFRAPPKGSPAVAGRHIGLPCSGAREKGSAL